MLTIFSTTKPFREHTKVIQTNAIRSWTLIRPKCEVILFGDEEGTTDIASQLGIRHISDVDHNEYGTPLVSSMFSIAQSIASYELMCYVNADIILMSDLLSAIYRIRRRPFLCIGQRHDIDIAAPLDFDSPNWETDLRFDVAKRGRLHPPTGMDYFTFTRGLYDDIPPFAIGRPKWDQWMVYRARSLHIPVIDATKVIVAIHQNHDYSHMAGGDYGYLEGPETKRNWELGGRKEYFLRIRDATWILTSDGLKPALSLEHIYFRWRAFPVLHPRWRFLVPLGEIALRLAGFIRRIVTSHTGIK